MYMCVCKCASVRLVVNECMCGYLRTCVASVARERSADRCAFAFIVVMASGGGWPASGGGQPASGSGWVPQLLAPGGRQVASGNPRRRCTMKHPSSESEVHCWNYTKAAAGARLDMYTGDWDKASFQAEVEAHDDILAHSAMQNKLKNSQVKDHECDTNFYLQLEGNCFATMGYSRHNDLAGRTHGWIMFGAGCRDISSKELAIKVFLNCMGFYDPQFEQPAIGGGQPTQPIPAPRLAPGSVWESTASQVAHPAKAAPPPPPAKAPQATSAASTRLAPGSVVPTSPPATDPATYFGQNLDNNLCRHGRERAHFEIS